MLLGLITFSIRARPTLGDIGSRPPQHPDPAVQAQREKQAKLILGVGLGILGLVVVLAATGIMPLNPQRIGQSMTYVLVGTAAVYFLYLFIAGGLTSDEKKRVGVIAVLFVAAAVFWSAFEQAPTSLNLFARDFTDRTIGGFEVPATWFQSVNAFFVVVFAPVAAATWLALSKRPGGDLSSPAKFAMGLALAGVGFFLMIFAANNVVSSGGLLKVSAFWLIGSYFFQTIGELALSPVGLSSMTKLSPRRYVGQMMGIWFLASAVGNLIGGLVGGHVDPENLEQMPRLFTLTTISLVVAAIVLGLLVVPIRKMMREVPANTT
jgi:proton-dependent oligopeptide transporter, POT family